MKVRAKKRILLDVDGVFANFIAGCLPHVHWITGRRHDHDDVDQFMIEKALDLDTDETRFLYEQVATEGWCRRLPAYQGAKEAIIALREFSEVWAVTQPYPSRTWAHERDTWLVEGFGFDINDVLHVRSKAKHAIDGDVLIEDKPSTLIEWQEWHPDGYGILFERAYNKSCEWTGARVRDWNELLSVVQAAFLLRA